MTLDSSDSEDDEKTPQKGPTFWDTGWAMLFLIAAILLARYYVLEPFKIPSGSMEPTLVGHEDYGDRILTNKLAYAPAWQVAITIALSAVFIGFAFIASRAWLRKRTIFVYAMLFIATVGGTGFLWIQDAVASVPKRFDVVVFEYEKDWEEPGSRVRMNYIKRLCGLPKETLVISGGDLFIRDSEDKDKIIRKWQVAPKLQEQFWYPVAKAWVKTTHHQMSDEDKARLAFPWSGAEAGKPGVKLLDHELSLDGSAPVLLDYKYRTTNLHIKQGRWSFKHVGCPATRLPGINADGTVWNNPDNAPSDIVRAYVTHPCEGVQCPQCKRVIFPLELGNENLQPWQPGSPVYSEAARDAAAKKQETLPPEVSRFFYGGDDTVGDLKIELELNVESADNAGSLEMEVGSNVHAARWTLGKLASVKSDETIHAVRAETPILTPGVHHLSLAYVDATVIALLDGREIERQLVDIVPIGREAMRMQSVAKVSLQGIKGRLTRLDLFRDQYYLPMLKGSAAKERARSHQSYDSEKSMTVITIPPDMFLMLGDNSPSSSDGRIWGFVPRKNIIGRAALVWWPMSRWRVITHGN